MFRFDNTFVRALPGLYEPFRAVKAPKPTLLAFNGPLAETLGVSPSVLTSEEGVEILSGNALPEGAASVAQAYAGHQFGHYSPRLGDGRALLLGEVLKFDGQRVDLHFKGTGPTPFSRGGDGKAAVGPMLREFLIGEAMHALGIPTTRALSVVATGEDIPRDTWLPGAVLLRVAQSHLRVGTFQFAAATQDAGLLKRLLLYAIERHCPAAAEAQVPALGFLQAVLDAQASLLSKWMQVGFVHGVMNTDNMTISGETIDYGPCAFLDAYHAGTVFSSIDAQGRYAFGAQPSIAQWNLARLAESLLPLVDANPERAVEKAVAVLETFPARFQAAFLMGMEQKLGLKPGDEGNPALVEALFPLLETSAVDFTSFFRALSQVLRGDSEAVGRLFSNTGPDAWLSRWRSLLRADADALDAKNPLYLPRNHKVEEALAAATEGNLQPFEALLEVVRKPFTLRPGLSAYEGPAPSSFGPYRTFCGT